MRIFKLGILFSMLVVTYSAAANSVFTITPSITALTLRSDSHTTIPYNVINSSSAVLNNITINPGYNTTAHLTMVNNNCSVLNPGESCQFNILINGQQQPDNFIISPAVCAFNHSICSQPTAQHRVNVAVQPILHPVKAYVGLSNNTLLPITLVNNALGIIGNAISGFHLNEPAGVCVSPDGAKVYVTNTGNNKLYVINAETQTISHRFPVGNVPTAVITNPSGNLLYVVNYNNGQTQGTLSILDALTGKLQRNILIGNGPWGIAQNSEGTRLYIANQYDNTVSVINTVNRKLIHTYNVGEGPLGIVAAPNAPLVYVANTRGDNISVINTLTNKVTHIRLGQGNLPKGLAINPDGTKLFVGNWQAGTISVIDTKTNHIIRYINLHAGPLGLAVNPEGTQLYATLDQVNAVAVVDLTTNLVDYLYVQTPQVTMGNFIG